MATRKRKQRQPKIFAVVNRKGGVAKTTTAINLAHGLSRRLLLRVSPEDVAQIEEKDRLVEFQGTTMYVRGHVLLVDLDPQGHCARGLGVDVGTADIGEVLLGRQTLGEGVVSADRAEAGYPRPNLWLLPSSDNLELAKQALLQKSLADGGQHNIAAALLRRLAQAVDRFAYIILDCPPNLDAFTQAIYHFAEGAIVPVKPDYFSMVGITQHVANIRESQMKGIDIAIHTIVPTMMVLRQNLDQEMMDSLLDVYGKAVAEPIPRSQMVAEAPAYHLTIFEYDPKGENPATVAYQQLVDRVYHG
ncbi:MAG: ParA family protein [Anaerolineae bacterium]|nr:ParA family protein [Anaerolineae bacterium]